jgi:succinate dehydrogenase/fumarate reductase flavoprotein subunit
MVSRANLPNQDLEFIQFHPTGKIMLAYKKIRLEFHSNKRLQNNICCVNVILY